MLVCAEKNAEENKRRTKGNWKHRRPRRVLTQEGRDSKQDAHNDKEGGPQVCHATSANRACCCICPDKRSYLLDRANASSGAGEATSDVSGALGADALAASLANAYRVRLVMVKALHVQSP